MNVILIDNKDEIIGVKDKIDAHLDGSLHRAYSFFVYNEKGEIMIQQRALNKYHSGGLWSNSFCSHFYEGETENSAIRRAAQDEIGLGIVNYTKVGQILYKSDVGSNMVEYELDHVYLGTCEGKVVLNSNEVMDYRWIDFERLCELVEINKSEFTEWLKIILKNQKIRECISNIVYGKV